MREPAAIACRAPAYPPEAKRRRETGTVMLGLLIDTEGSVIDRRIEQSSGSDTLDQAALNALAKCKFTPGTVDGRAQQAWARLRYVWKLE
ncbi:MAG: energy transducer TonB [Magnetospirillum sp.]|nr:energy transducer TonB [Magnetospirillum sp.]